MPIRESCQIVNVGESVEFVHSPLLVSHVDAYANDPFDLPLLAFDGRRVRPDPSRASVVPAEPEIVLDRCVLACHPSHRIFDIAQVLLGKPRLPCGRVVRQR